MQSVHCIVSKHTIVKDAKCPNTLLQIIESVLTHYCKVCKVFKHTIAKYFAGMQSIQRYAKCLNTLLQSMQSIQTFNCKVCKVSKDTIAKY